MNKENWKKLLMLLGLYIAQSIPMSFFSTVVPVIMRQENYSLEAIGMLQLVKLPWIIKFFWAPMVDKTGQTFRQLRRWIFFSELFYAFVILSVSFFSLEFDFKLIVALMLVAFVGSATQDIATDALAIKILKPDERSLGNSMQSAGSFTGTLVGSGVLLVLYHYFGWQVLLVCLAVFVLIAIVPLFYYRPTFFASNKSKKAVSFADVGRFFTQKGIARRIVLLFFYYAGIIGILAMLKPFLVDAGYSVKQIGWMNGIYGTSVAVVSSLAAGFIMKKLSRLKSLYLFSSLIALTTVFFFWLTFGNISTATLYMAITLIWGSYGMASVGIFTTSMDIVRSGREGTDFTMQIVFTHLSGLVMAVGSGKIAQAFEYRGLFIFEMAIAFSILAMLKVLYGNQTPKSPEGDFEVVGDLKG
jgi:predicted MFS family arabinose efflux permease